MPGDWKNKNKNTKIREELPSITLGSIIFQDVQNNIRYAPIFFRMPCGMLMAVVGLYFEFYFSSSAPPFPLPLPNNKNIPFKIKTNKRAKEKGRGNNLHLGRATK